MESGFQAFVQHVLDIHSYEVRIIRPRFLDGFLYKPFKLTVKVCWMIEIIVIGSQVIYVHYFDQRERMDPFDMIAHF